MGNFKFAAFGFVIGAMLIFLPMSGKFKEAKDLETKNKILMDISCALPKEELTEKLNNVVIPEDVEVIKEGQNEVLWNKAKESLMAECYG